MGIGNFFTYVDKALKWPTSLYEKDQDTKNSRLTVTDHKGKDIKFKDADYFDDVYRSFHQRLGIPTENVPSSTECTRTVQGICVDLSSFCYGVIVNEVTANQRRLQFPNSPPPFSLQPVQQKLPHLQDSASKSYPTTDSSLHIDTLAGRPNTTMRGAFVESERNLHAISDTSASHTKRKRCDPFEKLERNLQAIQESIDGEADPPKCDRIVVAVLDDQLIDECAHRCYEKLFDVIGHDAISNAHYFSLHYDENTTSCKWFEQYKRQRANVINVSKESRNRIYLETIKLVQMRLIIDTKARLTDILKNTTTGRAYIEDESNVLMKNSFINDVVLEKMQLSGWGPSSEIRKQRYASGEGEWKCFYTIYDLERTTDQRLCNTHCRWRVFGNDSDIALGVLLYTSKSSDIHYVSSSRKMIALPQQYLNCRPNAYRALHFLSLSLLGNDYVPRLVNASDRNIRTLGVEVERILNSEYNYCERYVDLLSHVFGSDSDTSSNDALSDDALLELSKAFTYVFARLLLSIYGDKSAGFDTGNTDAVEECFVRFYGTSGRQNNSRFVTNKTLRCKDGKDRSFAEYFAAFATCTFWYMAYCMFYRAMDACERKVFQTKLLNVGEGYDEMQRQLITIPKLPIMTPFEYNERRLHNLVRFEANIVQIRRALEDEDLTTYSLIGIMEKEIVDIFQK